MNNGDVLDKNMIEEIDCRSMDRLATTTDDDAKDSVNVDSDAWQDHVTKNNSCDSGGWTTVKKRKKEKIESNKSNHYFLRHSSLSLT